MKTCIPQKVIDVLSQPELFSLSDSQREDLTAALTFAFIEFAEDAGHVIDYQKVMASVYQLYRKTFSPNYIYSKSIH